MSVINVMREVANQKSKVFVGWCPIIAREFLDIWGSFIFIFILLAWYNLLNSRWSRSEWGVILAANFGMSLLISMCSSGCFSDRNKSIAWLYLSGEVFVSHRNIRVFSNAWFFNDRRSLAKTFHKNENTHSISALDKGMAIQISSTWILSMLSSFCFVKRLRHTLDGETLGRNKFTWSKTVSSSLCSFSMSQLFASSNDRNLFTIVSKLVLFRRQCVNKTLSQEK